MTGDQNSSRIVLTAYQSRVSDARCQSCSSPRMRNTDDVCSPRCASCRTVHAATAVEPFLCVGMTTTPRPRPRPKPPPVGGSVLHPPTHDLPRDVTSPVELAYRSTLPLDSHHFKHAWATPLWCRLKPLSLIGCHVVPPPYPSLAKAARPSLPSPLPRPA